MASDAGLTLEIKSRRQPMPTTAPSWPQAPLSCPHGMVLSPLMLLTLPMAAIHMATIMPDNTTHLTRLERGQWLFAFQASININIRVYSDDTSHL